MPPARDRKLDTPTKSNGNGVGASPAHRQLSPKESQKLVAWLDSTETPFSVTTLPLSKKRKRSGHAPLIQDDLWEDRLSVQYEVKPRDKWESLRKYAKFTVGSEKIPTSACVLVKQDDASGTINMDAQWKAKVLEIRAFDTAHVYLRVAWLNRPEDLDIGRKVYHGRHELIPTNQMDIITAESVNGQLEVCHWGDGEDDAATIDDEQYFWRQTLDVTTTKTFSVCCPTLVSFSFVLHTDQSRNCA